MSEFDRSVQPHQPLSQRWSSWDSPVGLGLFFVLIAMAVDLVRLALK